MKALRILIAVVLALVIMANIGCKKKQQKSPPQTRVEPAKPKSTDSKAGSNTGKPASVKPVEVAPAASKESNRQNPFQKPVKKEPALITEERPRPVLPIEPNALSKPEGNEPTLEQFATLTSQEEKTDWISSFADSKPEQIAVMAEKALDDSDVEVRSAAMNAVIDNETSAYGAISKGLKDTEEQIREQAAEGCAFLDDKQAGPLLAEAIADTSEAVRSAALEAASQKGDDTKGPVYRAGITSQYQDVKEATVPLLIDMSNQEAVDILIDGLNDTSPEFRDDVIQAIDFLTNLECKDYQQCKSLWRDNRNKFNKDLTEKE